jgi:hypothetical protein
VKVEPFEVWFSKIVDGVIEIEPVDVSHDLSRLKRISQNEKAGTEVPACPLGYTKVGAKA